MDAAVKFVSHKAKICLQSASDIMMMTSS